MGLYVNPYLCSTIILWSHRTVILLVLQYLDCWFRIARFHYLIIQLQGHGNCLDHLRNPLLAFYFILVDNGVHCPWHNIIFLLLTISVATFVVFRRTHRIKFYAKIWQDFVFLKRSFGTVYHTVFVNQLNILVVYISCFALTSAMTIIRIVWIRGGFCNIFPFNTSTVCICPSIWILEGRTAPL